MKTKLFLTTLLLLLSTSIFYAQNKKETVVTNIREAIRLMDAGKIDESIKLLKETEKIDPNNFDIPYEMAYANYLKEDYRSAIKILEKTKQHKDVNEKIMRETQVKEPVPVHFSRKYKEDEIQVLVAEFEKALKS